MRTIETAPITSTVLKVNSHRAGAKLQAALGTRPQYYYTWEHGGRFVILPKDVADRILPIKGITHSRIKETDLSKCWG